MKKCCIYIRTASQYPLGDKTFNSIEIQKQICLDYAKKNKYRVLKISQDTGVSGNSLKRKGLQHLLAGLKNHPVPAVIISDLDRFSRNFANLAVIKNSLIKTNTELIAVKEGVIIPNRKMLTVTVQITQDRPKMMKIKVR